MWKMRHFWSFRGMFCEIHEQQEGAQNKKKQNAAIHTNYIDDGESSNGSYDGLLKHSIDDWNYW